MSLPIIQEKILRKILVPMRLWIASQLAPKHRSFPGKHFYILNLHGAGDYLLASGAISSLIENGGDVAIVCGRPETQDLCKINHSHRSARIIDAQEFIHEISQEGSDVIIVSLVGPINDLKIFRAINGRQFIGFADNFRIRATFALPKDQEVRKDQRYESHIARNARVVQALGFTVRSHFAFTTSHTHLEKKRQKLILLALPSSKPLKSLSREQALSLYEAIRDFATKRNWDIDVRFLRFTLDMQMRDDDLVFSDWIGNVSYLKTAAAVITIDCVTLHICQALNIKCVALFGPTNPKNYIIPNGKLRVISKDRHNHCYYGAGHMVCTEHSRCQTQCKYMSALSTDLIIANAMNLVVDESYHEQGDEFAR